MRKLWYVVMLIMVGLLAGCAGDMRKSVNATQTQTPTLTLLPTKTRWPTWTPPPTRAWSTQTPTPRPVPTLRPTSTPRPTYPPVREGENLQAFVDEMMTTNGSCEFPCWWGITPGETLWRELVDTVRNDWQIHSSWHADEDRLTIYLPTTDYTSDYARYRVSFYKLGSFVRTIHVEGYLGFEADLGLQARSEPIGLLAGFPVAEVLTDYGVPDQVLGFVNNPTPGFIDLYLIYEVQGMLFDYTFRGIGDQSQQEYPCAGDGFEWPIVIDARIPGAIGCVDDARNWRVSLWLAPAGEVVDILSHAEAYAYSLIPPLSRATPVIQSTAAFWEVFQSSEPGYCLRLPYPLSYGDAPISESDPLLSAESSEGLQGLLLGAGGCTPPCWNGVTAGVTTADDLAQILRTSNRIYLRLDTEDAGNAVFSVEPMVRFDADGLLYFISETYEVQQGMVTGVIIEPKTLYHATFPTLMLQDWQAYSLRNILRRYGKPARVVPTLGYQACDAEYELNIQYDALGFEIAYTANGYHDGKHFTLCPLSDDLVGLRMVYGEDIPPFIGFETRQELKDIDVENFYSLFTGPQVDACMRLDAPEKCP